MTDDPYAPTPARALMMAQAMEREVNRAIWERTRPKGGQQVSIHGDFAMAPPSTLSRIKWWTREIRRCLGDDSLELTEESELNGEGGRGEEKA